MFSKTCEHAIRALIYIAQKSKDGNKIGIKEIAREIDSPEFFIAKILQYLSKHGFVNSIKGPRGGFFMAEDNYRLTIADIVRQVDGDKIFTRCALGLKECSEDHPCPVHHDFKHIKRQMIEKFESYQLSMFVEKSDRHMTFLKTF